MSKPKPMKCPRCKYKGKPIDKMGGYICEKCSFVIGYKKWGSK